MILNRILLPRRLLILSTSKSIHLTCQKSSNENYTTIYKFPYIRPVSLVNRVKLIQSVLTGLSIPCSVVLNQMNIISLEAVQVVGALGLSGCLSLYSLGYLTTKVIGFIYYNEEKETIKIAYIDFWGRRKDIEIPLKDIMPLSEMSFSVTDALYLKLRRYSTPDNFKINLKLGIVNDELIKKIL